MAYNSYNTLWESEIDGIVCKKDKLQDSNFNQLNLMLMRLIKRTKN